MTDPHYPVILSIEVLRVRDALPAPSLFYASFSFYRDIAGDSELKIYQVFNSSSAVTNTCVMESLQRSHRAHSGGARRRGPPLSCDRRATVAAGTDRGRDQA
jgi:hypothetical protein